MNSKSIKEKHKKIYEDFFSKNNLVISLPLLLNWSWDIFNNYKWIRVKQKLPFRIYLWINKIKKKKISFKTINYQDITEKNFIKSDLLEYAPFFLDFYTYLNKEYKNDILSKWWIEINIMSETSRGVWLAYISVVWLLLLIWLEKVYNNVDYINSNDILIDDFLNTNTPIDKLFRSVLKLNKTIWEKLSVENCISSFFDSYYPIVSFIEDTWNNLENIDISKIKIYWYRLNNLENSFSSVPFVPLDYGLIYSWRPVLMDHLCSTNEKTFNWTSDVKKNLSNYFWENLKETLPIRKPIFYKTFVSEDWDIFKDTYGRLMWAISLELLNIMIKLYSTSYTESNMRNFIDVINKIRYWNSITRKSSKTFADFVDMMFTNFKPSLRIFWLAPNDTSVMWWTAIFALPLEWLRKDFMHSLEETQKEIPWVKLLYANWLDWIENKWYIIEQDLEKWIYSEFINKNSLLIENIGAGTYISHNFSIEKINNNWLVLDLINKKIYLDWEKLTSKHIHSQNTTIDILKKLLSYKWKDISNKDLPKSSYSTNKNEMLWKIIIPLVKLIEEKKKIKLPLICKWTISDFYLKLSDSNLNISIVKNLS